MTDAEKLEKLKIILDIETASTDKDALLNLFLDISKQKILRKLYPFDKTKVSFDEEDDVESLNYIQIRIASFLYLRQGAEGEVSHNEGDIERSYGSSDIPQSFLEDIVPHIGVVFKE